MEKRNCLKNQMKYSLSILLSFFVLSTFVFCSSSSETNNEQVSDDDSISQDDNNQNPDIDDFNYLVLTPTILNGNGTVFVYEVGNNSGEIFEDGQIPGVDVVFLNTIISNNSKAFFYGQNLNPFEEYIVVFDKTTRTSERTNINIDTEVFGASPGIISMDWDSQRETIIAIIKSNIEFATGASKVVEIEPNTLEIQDLEIDLGNSFFPGGTTLKGSNLYVSALGISLNRLQDFFKVDIINKTVESLELQNLEGALKNLASNQLNNEFFGYSRVFGTQRGNATEPFILDIESKTYEPLLPEVETSNANNFSKSYFDIEQNTFVSFSSDAGKAVMIKYDIVTKEAMVVELSENNVIRNGAIVGKVEK